MTFETAAKERLADFLEIPADSSDIVQLTPDASTREFFRIPWKTGSAIACVYPEPIDESLPQIDVTRLFRNCGLPVAEIFQVVPDSGFLIHEDFGDDILRDKLLADNNPDKYIDAAIRLIAKIQFATKAAYESNSIASHLKFDLEKLVWELNFFKTHYFGSLKKEALETRIETALDNEFVELAQDMEQFATVLTHRDFHTANLMLQNGELKIIDHQDARIGSPCYDLVSLLLDRIEKSPEDGFINEKKDLLQTERTILGMDTISDIDQQFDLVTIQRCLKAIGTFSNQAANFEKLTYLRYIKPMFAVVAKACGRLGRFETIRGMAEKT